MYICRNDDTLTVCKMDGSKSKEYYHLIHCVRVCSDDGIVVHDDFGNLSKYSKDRELTWRIKPDTASFTIFFRFCLDSRDFVYCTTSDHQVKVYLPSGAFSHVLVSDLKHPNAIATDGDNNVHVGFVSAIQVFDAEGKMIRQYGHDELDVVVSIAISEANPQSVVSDSDKLFLFSITGSFLYTVAVAGMDCMVDTAFAPDNSLWIAIAERCGDFGRVLHVQKLFHQLPPPLSYLCELSILPHLNELPVTLLPPRLAGLFEKWTRLVTVQVSFDRNPYHRSEPLISETIELKVEPNVPVEMIQWLVSKKLNLHYSIISIRPGRDQGVDFVAGHCHAH